VGRLKVADVIGAAGVSGDAVIRHPRIIGAWSFAA
jgi:hypothetical protein